MNITLPPAQRRFVDDQVKTGRYQDSGEVVRAALGYMESYKHLAAMGGSDIMAMAFIVMMEAAKSAREDLKAIMDGVKAINTAKHRTRELLSLVLRDLSANAGCEKSGRALDFSRGLGSEQAYHRVPLPQLDPDANGGVRQQATNLHRGKITTAEDLRTIVDDMKGKLDSLSEMGEMESLRLQMAMDRHSKMMSTLSNLLKQSSDTAQSIIQNIK